MGRRDLLMCTTIEWLAFVGAKVLTNASALHQRAYLPRLVDSVSG